MSPMGGLLVMEPVDSVCDDIFLVNDLANDAALNRADVGEEGFDDLDNAGDEGNDGLRGEVLEDDDGWK